MPDLSKPDDHFVPSMTFLSNDGLRSSVAAWADPTTHRLLVNATLTGVSITTPSAVVNGQASVAVTNTAVALSTTATISGVVVQALAANTSNVVVGNSGVTTANGFQLQPGQATGIAIDDIAKVFVNGTSGNGVCFVGS